MFRCRPIRLPIVVKMVMYQVVRGDVRRGRVERSKRQHRAPHHVELSTLEDALVEMIVDDHRVEKAEVTRTRKKQRISAIANEIHRKKERQINRDNTDLSPLSGVLYKPRLPGG